MSESIQGSPTRDTTPRETLGEPSLVVGIGASAGGLDPLERLFTKLPTDSGMAFIVVQHLSPQFKSLMPELLARRTQMPIEVATEHALVKPNTVYLIPPRTVLELKNGRLTLQDATDLKANFPITACFRSLASDCGRRAVGVILSGSGTDGSDGISAIHEAGGLTIAQTLDSSKFDSMPQSAVYTGSTDLVLGPEEIAEVLGEYANAPEDRDALVREFSDEKIDLEEDILRSILEIVRKRQGVDFTLYKRPTIVRRLLRRMQHREVADVKDYLKIVTGEPNEVDQLFDELLLGVTAFFRDREAFDVAQDQVLAPLLTADDARRGLRVWAPGCSTGEEAYSVGMLILQTLDSLDLQVPVQVFATDIDQRALNRASAGVYSRKAVEELEPELVEKYFRPHPDGFEVAPELRRIVVFSRHDVTNDPPFSRTNLVVCRNLLIYLRPEAQEKVLALLHFSLESGGFLWLGSGEGTGPVESEFDVIDRRWRIYKKRRTMLLPAATTLLRRRAASLSAQIVPQASESRSESRETDAMHSLLSRFMPASLLVSALGDVAYVFGNAKSLLKPRPGKASLNVSQMLDDELRMAVTSSLQRSRTEGKLVEFRAIRAQIEGDEKRVDLAVHPLDLSTDRQAGYLIVFDIIEPTEIDIPESELDAHSHLVERIEELERELAHSRGNLQAAVEELQTTNEELLASNEELQSTNEELHSVNEELFTVNTEHQRKIEELSKVRNDIENLLTCSEVGIVFLDASQKIRMFTPAASNAVHLRPHDLGRPIGELQIHLDVGVEELIELTTRVLATGNVIEREVRGPAGYFLMRILPHRPAEGGIGSIMTFFDISNLRGADHKDLDLKARWESSVQDLEDFAYVVSHELRGPIRTISGYAELLVGRDKEDEERVTGDANQILTSARVLERQVSALLGYTRVRTRAGHRKIVDAAVLVQTTLDNLRTDLDSVDAKVEVGDLPDIECDAEQIRSVFEELVGNAIKFRSERPLEIEIRGGEDGTGSWIEFTDNGQGFEPDQAERAFALFRRLVPRDHSPGDGVGLALARRIVDCHGGTLNADPRPGEGCTFRMTLPIRSRQVTIRPPAGGSTVGQI